MLLLGVTIVAVVTGIVSVTTGLVPFLGLVVPNLVSRLIGDHMRRAVPLVALLGAALVLACDLVGRLVRFPFEIPISIVMGIVGGTVFLWLLLGPASRTGGATRSGNASKAGRATGTAARRAEAVGRRG